MGRTIRFSSAGRESSFARAGIQSANMVVPMPDISALLTALDSVGLFHFLIERTRAKSVLVRAFAEHADALLTFLPEVPIHIHDLENEAPAGTIVLDCRPPGQAPGDASTISLFTDAVACFIAGANSLARPPRAGRCYYLLGTPRCGSTFVCDLLTSTRRLGRPTEHLKPWLRDYLTEAGLSFATLIDSLHCYAATPNGIFGSKVVIDDLFAFLPDFADEVFAELRRSTVFLLLRGDKCAQAVSNVRSNRLSLYHVHEGEQAERALRDITFDADIAETFAKERWLLRQEGDLMDLLRQWNVHPKILSYESCVQSRKMAAVVLDEIAAIMGTDLAEGYSWPTLVRIGTAVQPAPLLRYTAFRATTRLYSTRSEPWLGAILGAGWCEPEKWGVRAPPGRLEIHVRHFAPVRFFELVINITPISPHHLTVGSVTLELSRPESGYQQWHWFGALEDTMPEIETLLIEFEDGELELEEVVFYTRPVAKAGAFGALCR
jgi:LPS sulfotransferase NodH